MDQATRMVSGIIEATSFDSFQIVFDSDEEFLEYLLLNLLQNVEDVAVRARRGTYRVELTTEVTDGVVFLCVTDDVGELNGLRDAVEQVNRGERPVSRRTHSGGTGLLSLRAYMREALMRTEP